MKRIFSIFFAVVLAVSLMLVPATSVGATNSSTILLDSVNIGDTTSEAGHNLLGWSDPWTWGGGYGGGDDGTFRLLMGPGDGCTDHEDAYFTMSAGAMCADKLVLHHLDGSQPDDFIVYVLDGGVYTLIGSYAKQTSGETWETSEYYFSPRGGEIQFKLLATSPVQSWCLAWGQVAFSWAELYGPYPVTIDIKPGSDPNSINLKDQGVLPVAILGSEDFDVYTIDLAKPITLGGTSVTSRGSGKKAPKLAVSFEDVDGDGLMDLVAFFRVQELVDSGALDENTTELMLEAETTGGVPISGTDTVNVVPDST